MNTIKTYEQFVNETMKKIYKRDKKNIISDIKSNNVKEVFIGSDDGDNDSKEVSKDEAIEYVESYFENGGELLWTIHIQDTITITKPVGV